MHVFWWVQNSAICKDLLYVSINLFLWDYLGKYFRHNDNLYWSHQIEKNVFRKNAENLTTESCPETNLQHFKMVIWNYQQGYPFIWISVILI